MKIQEKSIKNRCKINARTSDAKNIENDTIIHSKWEPKSIPNLKNTGKNDIRKLMPKFDVKQVPKGRNSERF